MNALVLSRKQAVQSTIFSIKEDRFAVEVLRGQEIKLIHPVSNSSFRECLSQDLIFFIAVLTFNNIKQCKLVINIKKWVAINEYK